MAKLERLITPSGVKTISENGEYEIASYESVDVNVEGKVEIPQVSNLAIDEDGILTFDIPDYSELEQYNPTISYIININDNVIETSGNSASVKEYATEGENNVVVITKVAINGLGKDGVIEYVPSEEGEYAIITFNLDDASYLQPSISCSGFIGDMIVKWSDGEEQTISSTNIIYAITATKPTPFAQIGVYSARVDVIASQYHTKIQIPAGFGGSNYKTKVSSILFSNKTTNVPDEMLKDNTKLSEFVGIKNLIIGQYAFRNCTNLTNIELKEGTTINSNAFRGCTKLQTVVIPTGVTFKGEIFMDCTGLESATILADLTSIPNGVFRNCTNLQSVDLSHCTTVPTLESTYAFYNVHSSCQIIIPDELYDAWIVATNWVSLTNVTYVKSSEVN